MTRIRRKVNSTVTGNYRYGADFTPQTAANNASLVIDEEGYHFHNYFFRSKYEVTGGLLQTNFPSEFSEWNDCPTDWFSGANLFETINSCPVPDQRLLVAKLLAMTNPSKPDVSLPNFLFEIREIPSTIKDLGFEAIRKLLSRRKSLVGTAAKANLAFQFGLQPLISDVNKMLGFTHNVDKRFRELSTMRASGGNVYKRTVHQDAKTFSETRVLHSRGPFVRANSFSVANLEVRGYAQWVLDNPLPTSDAELLKLARKASLGLSIDPTVAWNAMPWSWLIDWYGNTGDIATASQNIIGASPGIVRLMDHHTVVTNFLASDPNWKLTDMSVFQDTINRYNPGNDLQFAAKMPMLTPRQLGILGSLLINKGGASNPYLR